MFEGIGEWLRQLELEGSRSGKKRNAFHLRQLSIHKQYMAKRLSRKLWLRAFSSIMDWETKIGSLGPIRKNTQSFSQDSEGLYPKRKGKPKRANSHKDWNETLSHFSSFLDQANLFLFQYLPEEKTILSGKICYHPQP